MVAAVTYIRMLICLIQMNSFRYCVPFLHSPAYYSIHTHTQHIRSNQINGRFQHFQNSHTSFWPIFFLFDFSFIHLNDKSFGPTAWIHALDRYDVGFYMSLVIAPSIRFHHTADTIQMPYQPTNQPTERKC